MKRNRMVGGERETTVRLLKGPTEKNTHWPPELLWRTQSYDRPGADHVAGEIVLVPEGIQQGLYCTACGGRREWVIDLRAMPLPDDIEQATAQLAPHFKPIQAATEEFGQAHAQCVTTPTTWPVDARVQRLLDGCEQKVRASLAKGEFASVGQLVLFGNDEIANGDINDILPGVDNESQVARGREIRSRIFAMREYARAHGVPVDAVLNVSEAWAASVDRKEELAGDRSCVPVRSDKYEVVMMAWATRDYARMRIWKIKRRGGVQGEGPGELVDRFEGPVGSSRMMDGLCVIHKGSQPDPFGALGETL